MAFMLYLAPMAFMHYLATGGVIWRPPPLARAVVRACACSAIQLQSDYGRGKQHLSFDLEDGDVVAYQVGTWLVDAVEVGDGSPARIRFAVIDNVQLVWTHDCEHGVCRGFALAPNTERDVLELEMLDEDVEFGPEQLVARWPCGTTSPGASFRVPPEFMLPGEFMRIIEQ